MKIIYVIGAGTGLDAIEKARRALALSEETEIICIENMEDVPFKERLKSDPSLIQQIYTIKNLRMAEPYIPYFEKQEKRKGHERPYKYHG